MSSLGKHGVARLGWRAEGIKTSAGAKKKAFKDWQAVAPESELLKKQVNKHQNQESSGISRTYKQLISENALSLRLIWVSVPLTILPQ